MQIRDYFTFFQNNPNIVYLDSAATSQKPQIVVDEVSKYLINTKDVIIFEKKTLIRH